MPTDFSTVGESEMGLGDSIRTVGVGHFSPFSKVKNYTALFTEITSHTRMFDFAISYMFAEAYSTLASTTNIFE